MALIDTILPWAQVLQSLIILAAAGTLYLTYRQVRLRKEQSTTQFEDDLTREYRELARRLPVKALLGDELTDEELEENFKHFYYYVDLCNEQIFLRHEERVSPETWENWCDGIESNLTRPAFRETWEEIKKRSDGSFQELRRLERSGFQTDPAEWDQI